MVKGERWLLGAVLTFVTRVLVTLSRGPMIAHHFNPLSHLGFWVCATTLDLTSILFSPGMPHPYCF